MAKAPAPKGADDDPFEIVVHDQQTVELVVKVRKDQTRELLSALHGLQSRKEIAKAVKGKRFLASTTVEAGAKIPSRLRGSVIAAAATWQVETCLLENIEAGQWERVRGAEHAPIPFSEYGRKAPSGMKAAASKPAPTPPAPTAVPSHGAATPPGTWAVTLESSGKSAGELTEAARKTSAAHGRAVVLTVNGTLPREELEAIGQGFAEAGARFVLKVSGGELRVIFSSDSSRLQLWAKVQASVLDSFGDLVATEAAAEGNALQPVEAPAAAETPAEEPPPAELAQAETAPAASAPQAEAPRPAPTVVHNDGTVTVTLDERPAKAVAQIVGAAIAETLRMGVNWTLLPSREFRLVIAGGVDAGGLQVVPRRVKAAWATAMLDGGAAVVTVEREGDDPMRFPPEQPPAPPAATPDIGAQSSELGAPESEPSSAEPPPAPEAEAAPAAAATGEEGVAPEAPLEEVPAAEPAEGSDPSDDGEPRSDLGDPASDSEPTPAQADAAPTPEDIPELGDEFVVVDEEIEALSEELDGEIDAPFEELGVPAPTPDEPTGATASEEAGDADSTESEPPSVPANSAPAPWVRAIGTHRGGRLPFTLLRIRAADAPAALEDLLTDSTLGEAGTLEGLAVLLAFEPTSPPDGHPLHRALGAALLARGASALLHQNGVGYKVVLSTTAAAPVGSRWRDPEVRTTQPA